MWISISNDQHRLFISELIDEKIGLHQPISAITTTLHTTVISPCATTYPRPDPVYSHALIPQVPWIPGSRHSTPTVKGF